MESSYELFIDRSSIEITRRCFSGKMCSDRREMHGRLDTKLREFLSCDKHGCFSVEKVVGTVAKKKKEKKQKENRKKQKALALLCLA